MEATANRSVAVVGTGTDAETLKQIVTSAGWSCALVPPTNLEANAGTLERAAAVILSTDAEGIGRFVPSSTPIIACCPSLPTSVKPVSWLPKPSAPVLRALLEQLLGLPPPPNATTRDPSEPPPSVGKWRRKTDMIVGRSVAIRDLLETLNRIASSPAAVSITGESGTGKELVARALHYSSPRANAPFVALNCSAIPESLFEAELFGYVRGAFTGAVASRMGAFEAANNGTLFLDEIGEMPLTLQPKLLRVLERGEVTRLGSNEPRKVAVRVVTATNRNLEDEVRAGKFRQDLFYRLRVCHVHIPPLRERIEDLAPLIAHHLSIITARDRRETTPRLSSAAFQKLLEYSWPGNVRELVNVLEAAVLLAPTNVIEAEHIQLTAATNAGNEEKNPPILSYREAKARFESNYYANLLRAARGNISLAAKLAQKTRKEVYDALRRAGLEVSAYRDDELA